jgi:hypothetical protein
MVRSLTANRPVRLESKTNQLVLPFSAPSIYRIFVCSGYYNDHHYHYGYHVYAAAVVAKYDPVWAKQHFDQVLLYIRDFANPSENDQYFTAFRQKDWWLGSSWASGIISAENSPHGRNEESSSEAIAAYESVALYGQVMMDVMRKDGSHQERETAKLIRDVGELLTVTGKFDRMLFCKKKKLAFRFRKYLHLN